FDQKLFLHFSRQLQPLPPVRRQRIVDRLLHVHRIQRRAKAPRHPRRIRHRQVRRRRIIRRQQNIPKPHAPLRLLGSLVLSLPLCCEHFSPPPAPSALGRGTARRARLS